MNVDRAAALQAYIRAILPEREDALYQRALGKARAILSGMKPEEAEAYLAGKAFANTLYHVRRADECYQALLKGELAMDYHRAEFERLEPLISEALEQGEKIDLDLMRSVERSRVPMKKAQAALVQVAAAPQSGSVAEQSSDQLEIKTSRFPKTKKNINLRSSPR